MIDGHETCRSERSKIERELKAALDALKAVQSLVNATLATSMYRDEYRALQAIDEVSYQAVKRIEKEAPVL